MTEERRNGYTEDPCRRCGHKTHIAFWPGCPEEWFEPDGWSVDCGCRG